MNIKIACLLITAIGLVDATDLDGFRVCVSAAGSGTCTLDPNYSGGVIVPWPVSTTIEIGRSNLNIQGHPSFPGQVTVKRTAGIYSIIHAPSTVSGVSITNLVVDGNRAQFSGAFADVGFDTGSWNNFVTSSTFKNAPDRALVAPYYAYVQYCNFYDAANWAVLAYSNTNNTTDIGIYYSYFTRTGANAVYLNTNAVNSIVYGNEFVGNHNACPFSGQPGGEILLQPGTSGIYVQNNIADGNYSSCGSYGLEGYGSGHQITGNTFRRHNGPGIAFRSASGITISNNTIELNNHNAIDLAGQAPGMPCTSNPTYYINSNTFRNNLWYGVYAARMGCPAGPSSSTVFLNGNTNVGGLGMSSLDNP